MLGSVLQEVRRVKLTSGDKTLGVKTMISQVIRFQNGMVMVFDEKGEQMPEYQGRYEDVKERILADASRGARFFHGVWNVSGNAVPREEW